MDIKLIAVGKVREQYITQGIEEYLKRLKKYCKVSVIDVEDKPCPLNLSKKEIDAIKHKESLKVMRNINPKDYVIALCIEGRQIDSLQLSKTIEQLTVKGISSITFVIGGSLGLCDSVKQRADFKLSFSALTFPHQLMKLILLEQIYRSFKISFKEPYHR